MLAPQPLGDLNMTLFKSLVLSLIMVLALLEYRFWLGGDSILKVRALKNKLATQEKELLALKYRNNQLIFDIENLKKHPIAIEEQARYELGMVKHGEKYFQVVEPID